MAEINPWLVERLGIHNAPAPTLVNVLIEVEPERLEEIQSELGRLGIRVNTARISFGRYVPAAVPTELLVQVAGLPGVLKVDKNMPVTVRLMNPFQDLLGAVVSPISRVIPTLPTPTFTDEILGQVRMSQVEIPGMPALGPAGILFGLLPPKRPDINIIPTGVVRESLKVPEDDMIGLVVGLIDTGITPTHPQFNPLNTRIEGLSVTGEPFIDGQGHGMWVSTAAFGGPFQTPFGMCRGIASPDAGRGGKIVHVKALSNIGAGTTDGIMKAIELCLERGCKVVSLSLGSELQGGVDQDPLCRLITQYQNQAVFVVAAGNSGPDPWTIGSPAASPGALCVGAMSLMDYEVSWFSSRGPSGAWYRNHQDDWTCDLQRYGEALIKPDIVLPGGGRALKVATPDEVLYSGCLHEDTLVYTPVGPVPIKALTVGHPVWSFADRTIVGAECTAVLPKGEREMVEIIASGMALKATPDHKFLRLHKGQGYGRWKGVDLEWAEAGTLLPGDIIVAMAEAPERVDPNLDSLIPLEAARCLGYFAGDGWLHRNGEHRLGLATGEEGSPYVEQFEKVFAGFGVNFKHDPCTRSYYDDNKRMAMCLSLLGLGQKHKHMALPEWLWAMSHEKQQGFIHGLYDADGTHEKRDKLRMGFGLASMPMVRGVQALARYSGWTASNIYSHANPGGLRGWQGTSTINEFSITRHSPHGAMHTHHDLVDSSLRFVAVRKVQAAGKGQVYDISVKGTETFIAEGTVVHNCVPWFDGFYDLVPNLFEGMHGTSMAAPLAAGLIALALDRGTLPAGQGLAAVRAIMSRLQVKNPNSGYGVMSAVQLGLA